MKIIDRYLGRTVIISSLMTLLILMLISGFFAFIDEIGDIHGDYTAIKALEYVLSALPSLGYELFPTAILLGALLSMGAMASHSELIVLRAAGISLVRITGSVLKAGLLLMLIGILLGEVIAPVAEQHGQKIRTAAQTSSTAIHSRNGIWTKQKKDFVQIGKVFPDMRLVDVTIYTFGEHSHLARMIRAKEASYQGDTWDLKDVTITVFEETSFRQKRLAQMTWRGLVEPSMFDALTVEAPFLSIISLYKYIKHLKQSKQDAAQYELAFWMKIFKPFSALIMLLIAMPFLFGSLRSSSMGQRLLVGVLLGLGFHMFNQALNHIGVGYGLNPIMSAALPSLVFATGGIIALRKIF